MQSLVSREFHRFRSPGLPGRLALDSHVTTQLPDLIHREVCRSHLPGMMMLIIIKLFIVLGPSYMHMYPCGWVIYHIYRHFRPVLALASVGRGGGEGDATAR